MADAILMSGGTNGATSNDVTASKAQVLQGYKTVTSDSDDEIIEGIIQVVDTSQNDYRKTRTTEYGLDKSRNVFYMHLPQKSAFYTRPDNTPHVEVDANVLGDATTGKVLKNSIFTSKYGLAMQGAIEPRGTWVIASEVVNASGEGTVHVRFEEGYYSNDGQYKPTAKIPYAVLTNVLGIDANKMLSNLTVAGIAGNIKMINTQDSNYRINKSAAFGIDGWSDVHNPVFWIDFPHGNGFYCRNDNHPHVCIDAVNLGTAGADSVLSGQTATSVQGVKFAGAIQRWICTTGDVISAVNNEGFAWDDSYAGRGRGIVMKIPNKHFIQDANWVFLSSPNLYPHNIVKDVNINGAIGTRDFVDKVNEYAFATNVEISMQNRNQSISLGNAYANSETVFFGVEIVGEDVFDGFVRRDRGNGRYLIGRIPVSKNDSNLLGTFIRNTPVQIEIARDNAGNISLIHHGPNQVLGATKLNIYIYAHSSISFRF